jgi:23S rRNA pseudouridine1911/1915/1917 synthase
MAGDNWQKEVEADDRVDRWVHGQLAGYSLARVRELIASGRVRVNGFRVQKGDRLAVGDVVTVADVVSGPGPVVEAGELEVVYEDEAVAVVNKPAGWPTHPLSPEETGTLINLTVGRFPATLGVGPRPLEPGLLHRLDIGTQGLVLLALEQPAFDTLLHDLRMGRIKKTYRALVHGELKKPSDEINMPLARSSRDYGLMVPAVPGASARGKPLPAVTRYRVLESDSGVSLLELDLLTGVQHQLRAHLALIGHPVLGDNRYGPNHKPDSRAFALQAARLEFRHPHQDKNVHAQVSRLLALEDRANPDYA